MLWQVHREKRLSGCLWLKLTSSQFQWGSDLENEFLASAFLFQMVSSPSLGRMQSGLGLRCSGLRCRYIGRFCRLCRLYCLWQRCKNLGRELSIRLFLECRVFHLFHRLGLELRLG